VIISEADADTPGIPAGINGNIAAPDAAVATGCKALYFKTNPFFPQTTLR
jgi:hypothetical protein